VELVKLFTSDCREQQPAGARTSPDVEALLKALDASDRYRRDSRLGRIYHRGAASYREVRSTDSFHIVIDGSRVSVHVDRISPLRRRSDGSARLSPTRIFAHNLAGARDHLTRRLRRHLGPDRRADDAAMVVTVPLNQP
jgi:hypothetical protein